jgi:hypothetical protein
MPGRFVAGARSGPLSDIARPTDRLSQVFMLSRIRPRAVNSQVACATIADSHRESATGRSTAAVRQNLGVLFCQAMFTAMGMLACPPAVTATLMHAVGTAQAAGGPTEADWIRWAGVAVGMIGAVVVAPAGTLVIVGQAAAAARRMLTWARSKLARWIPWLRRDATVHGVTATAHLSAGGGAVATGRASVYGGSPEQQIAQLREELQEIWGELREARSEARDNHAALSARVDRETGQLRSEHQALTEELKAERRRDAQIDARGLPLIGLGILLAGVPDGLAVVGWLGWAVVAFSACLAVWLGVWPAGAWLWRKVRRS